MRYEVYRAVAQEEAAIAFAKQSKSPFTIEVRFVGGLTETQKLAFQAAADRWVRVIVGDLPAFNVNGELIDDLMIEASGEDIDGPGGILGEAGPTDVRPAAAGGLPAKGVMRFDKADLADMEANGTLIDVITHEMGHVLGIGTLWQEKGLLIGANTNTPLFVGNAAQKEFGKLRHGAPQPVPVEQDGGPGTAGGHWDEETFRNELMTGFVSGAHNPLSRLTVASLKDLGYVVNMTAAQHYTLPLAGAIMGIGLPTVNLGQVRQPPRNTLTMDDSAQ